jgi:hypothetical protein
VRARPRPESDDSDNSDDSMVLVVIMVRIALMMLLMMMMMMMIMMIMTVTTLNIWNCTCPPRFASSTSNGTLEATKAPRTCASAGCHLFNYQRQLNKFMSLSASTVLKADIVSLLLRIHSTEKPEKMYV